MLLFKNYDKLSDEEKVVFDSYKNRVNNLLEYMENPVRADWNFGYEIFHNLSRSGFQNNSIWAFYRAMYDVTSYYQANKAGPEHFWSILIKTLGPNQKLFLQNKLSKMTDNLGLTNSKWIGNKEDDVISDVANVVSDSLLLFEFKMRVDSGCYAGRNEIVDSKFSKILQHLKSGKKLYSVDGVQMSLSELLREAKIDQVEMYLSVLFDILGKEATEDADKAFICYGAMKKAYNRLVEDLRSDDIELEPIKPKDNRECFLHTFEMSKIKVILGTKYGNRAIDELFKGKGKGIDSLKSKIDSYLSDDLWICQLIAISERAILLQSMGQNNYLTLIKATLDSDFELRSMTSSFLTLARSNATGVRSLLESIVSKIMASNAPKFKELPQPYVVTLLSQYEKYDLSDYIGDIVQVLLAAQ